MRRGNIFTIPAGAAFLPTLANAILDGTLPGGRAKPEPLQLPDYTLLMPTRRAERALAEAFLKCSGHRAMLLPTIRPIADRDEDEALLSGLAEAGAEHELPDQPPAIDKLDRVLALTQLVLGWSKAMRAAGEDPTGEVGLGPVVSTGAGTPAQAAHLAAELGNLMDIVETENVSLDGLSALVPDSFADHWQQTLQFLEIITAHWPAHLKEQGLVNPAWRRNALILAEARRLAETRDNGPVIVAGVTGSIPATAELMRAVCSLEAGAIVLPGLDMTMDEDSWQCLSPEKSDAIGDHSTAEFRAQNLGHPEHPQFGLKRLLDRLGVTRDDIQVLMPAATDSASPAVTRQERQRFISETMRPTGTTHAWHEWVSSADKDAVADALEHVSLIEAPSAQDEAEVAALILREAAETPGRTAALVSPDRLLARRVASRLESWGIRVDDSAGRPFIKTAPGAFLDLVIACITKRFAPAELMALLKHPLCRIGMSAFEVRRSARALELIAFRAPYLGDGLSGVADAIERAARSLEDKGPVQPHKAVRRLWEDDWTAARDLAAALQLAFEPLREQFERTGDIALQDLARAHISATELLTRLPAETDETGVDKSSPDGSPEPVTNPLYNGEAGETASLLFQKLLDADALSPAISAYDYADFYRTLVATENVRQRLPVHPRLFIWGPFEARLQQPDIVILSGLNDGKWPEAADPGPWLNRPMRQALGLPSPEERIGYSAHDFTSLLGCETVYLTRALKVDGDPTVASRWLLRITALLDGLQLRHCLEAKEPWLEWALLRNRTDTAKPAKAPAPRPPQSARPRRLSVSAVETWLSNPYAIFARHIVQLERLPALAEPPGAGLRGSVIHDAMARFAKAHPRQLPDNAFEDLMRFAHKALEDFAHHPRIAAFWHPRFERFARWFADTEEKRREGIIETLAEVPGRMVLDAPAGPFTLTARADRIDIKPDGIVISDYKTGRFPADGRVREGAAPQLALEAAIALSPRLPDLPDDQAGFPGIPDDAAVKALRYIQASGAEPPGDEHDVKIDDIVALAQDTLEGLKTLIARFDDADTPYAALRRSKFDYSYDDYSHLARVAEWSGGTGDGEDSDQP